MIIVFLGKCRVRKMKLVPQGHIRDKRWIPETGFKAEWLAPDLGMFNPYSTAREAINPGEVNSKGQEGTAAAVPVGITIVTIFPLALCPHGPHGKAIFVYSASPFLSATVQRLPSASSLSPAQSLNLKTPWWFRVGSLHLYQQWSDNSDPTHQPKGQYDALVVLFQVFMTSTLVGCTQPRGSSTWMCAGDLWAPGLAR